MSRPKQQLTFRTIDMEQHVDITCQYREDSFVASFGNADNFYEADGLGKERYITWLADRIQAYPEGHVHAWLNDEIIGQIEAKPRQDSNTNAPPRGYINLYYIALKWRGMGYGAQLDDYVKSWFRKLGCDRLMLSVSPTNTNALAFYTRQGWKDCGPRPNHPNVHLMEKLL